MRQVVLIPQLVAVALLLGLAWYVWQPIGGDLAFWSPAFSTFLIAAVWVITGGCLVWWRWGMDRALMLADVAALPLIFIGTIGVLWLLGGVVAIVLLVGLVVTWRRRHIRPAGLPRRPRSAARPLLIVLALPLAALWWYSFTVAYDLIGDLTGYGLTEIMIGGTAGAAVLLWLDERPGALLGAGLALIHIGAGWAAGGVEYGDNGAAVLGSLLVGPGILAAGIAARDLAVRPRSALLASLVIAVSTFVLLEVAPFLAPLAIVAALALESPAGVAPPLESAPATA